MGVEDNLLDEEGFSIEFELPIDLPGGGDDNDDAGSDDDFGIDEEDDMYAGEEDIINPAKISKEVAEEKGAEDKGGEDEGADDGEPISILAEFLHEEGVIELEEEVLKSKKIDADTLKESVSKSIKKGVEAFIENQPDSVKKLLEFVKEGGDPETFMEQIYAKGNDVSKLDTNKESDQETIVRMYLKAEGWEQDEIDDEIDDLKDRDRLETKAVTYHKRLKQAKEAEQAKLVEEQAKAVREREMAMKRHLDEYENLILESEELAGFKVPKEERQKFRDYLLKPVGKTGKSQYAIDMEKGGKKDAITLAFLKFKNFEFKDVERKAASKAVSAAREKLDRLSSSGNQSKNKAPDFSAFKLSNIIKKK